MTNKMQADMNDDIQKRFALMSPQDQAAFVKFQEDLAGLKPGQILEFRDAVFCREQDGSLSALLPRDAVDAWNKRFPEDALEERT